MTADEERLPAWVIWQPRPFPDANLLLLAGREPVLVDSGFVGHAEQTAAWARAHVGDLTLVLNTHWHSDHVGGNAMLQAAGAGVAASVPTLGLSTVAIRAAARLSTWTSRLVPTPSTCRCTTPEPSPRSGRLGDHSHARSHARSPVFLAAQERLLVVGDALLNYDVGWANLALDGPDAAATVLASLRRLADLKPRVIMHGHGPIPADPGAAFATALRRAQRLVDDPAGAVRYAARRIFAFALMIRSGIPTDQLEPYLLARAWLTDAARLLTRIPEAFATELVNAMLNSGTVTIRDRRLHATAEHSPVTAESLQVPFPRAWPAAE